MIEVDHEIKVQIKNIEDKINDIEKKIKFKKILLSKPIMILAVIFIMWQCSVFGKGLRTVFNNTSILVLLVLLNLGVLIFLLLNYYTKLENELEILIEEKQKQQEEKEKILDFLAYLTACRHIESVKSGDNIYPELRFNDSMAVYNEYKDKYETERIKYEKNHKISN